MRRNVQPSISTTGFTVPGWQRGGDERRHRQTERMLVVVADRRGVPHLGARSGSVDRRVAHFHRSCSRRTAHHWQCGEEMEIPGLMVLCLHVGCISSTSLHTSPRTHSRSTHPAAARSYLLTNPPKNPPSILACRLMIVHREQLLLSCIRSPGRRPDQDIMMTTILMRASSYMA